MKILIVQVISALQIRLQVPEDHIPWYAILTECAFPFRCSPFQSRESSSDDYQKGRFPPIRQSAQVANTLLFPGQAIS